MITEDQTPVISFLASPATHGGAHVERIETHTATVFLAGRRAYKLKRAVRYDYLDFSTCERRRMMCEAEVRLNRRTAPAIYIDAVPVTQEGNGALALGGSGRPVDWVVEMHRFEQDALFDRLAAAGRLHLTLMAPLSRAIAAFHVAAEPRVDRGGVAGMTWVIEGNAAGLAELGAACLDSSAADRAMAGARAEVERRGTLLEGRRAAGLVRQCHGDLHLRNIVLLDGLPTLFDGVEFSDAVSCTDVLYDLAFLVMDLWRRGLPRHASAVWNHYLAETGDISGICLLPLFLSCRAAVRAKTSATAAQAQSEIRRRRELYELAREYLALAERLLHPPLPSLIAVGGLSGSGKSTLALALAPSVGAVPGAVVLRSDEVRKQLCGVRMLDHLGPDAYSAEISTRVYATLAERARKVIQGGHSAIVDAVHARLADRIAIERVASNASVPFLGIWLDAPASALMARTEQRRNDPSDADPGIVRLQQVQETGPIAWERLDAARPVDLVLQAAVSFLRQHLLDHLNTTAHG